MTLRGFANSSSVPPLPSFSERDEVVLPYGSVPISRTAFQQFRAPDVVDEHVDVAVVFPNLLGQLFHLVRFEMVDCDCNTGSAEMRDELGSLFDRLSTVVVGPC